jgi:hypothetical protein
MKPKNLITLLLGIKYDTNQGGYVVDLTREQLEGAPTFATGDQPFRDRAAEQRIHDYYKTQPYWI